MRLGAAIQLRKPQDMTASTQSMFFKSKGVDAHWDTWMFYHEGTFYLFYLITEYSPGEGFGLATSPDGVTWTDHGWAIKASDKMVTYLGTGAVWKSPDFDSSGRFICNYSEWRVEEDGRQTQNIFFAWSEDLMNWTKVRRRPHLQSRHPLLRGTRPLGLHLPPPPSAGRLLRLLDRHAQRRRRLRLWP